MATIKYFNTYYGKEVEIRNVRTMQYYHKELKIICATGERFFIKYKDMAGMNINIEFDLD